MEPDPPQFLKKGRKEKIEGRREVHTNRKVAERLEKKRRKLETRNG